jgi:hypothetical protein
MSYISGFTNDMFNNNIYMNNNNNMITNDNMNIEYIIDNIDNSCLSNDRFENNEDINEIKKIRNNITNIFNSGPDELNGSLNESVNASETKRK